MTTSIAPIPAERTQATPLNILSAAVADARVYTPRPGLVCRTDADKVAYGRWFYVALQAQGRAAKDKAAYRSKSNANNRSYFMSAA